MDMLVNGKAHVDPNNVPLASLVAQEEHVDVNFINTIISTTMLIGTTLVITIISHILPIVVMVIFMVDLECLVRKGF